VQNHKPISIKYCTALSYVGNIDKIADASKVTWFKMNKIVEATASAVG
jgi:hypothetical protein